MDTKIITKEGLDKLEKELDYLKNTKRHEMSQRIKIAKDHGDLSENAEYHEAKDEQGFVEGRILELEHLLKTAIVAEEVVNSDIVVVGSSVVVDRQGERLTLTIVGSTEADPARGKISLESPIGEALLDKKVNDEVEVKLPNGIVVYKILEIK